MLWCCCLEKCDDFILLILQLPGIVRMFASEMTVASAWIHLLAVDLFAARSRTTLNYMPSRNAEELVNICVLYVCNAGRCIMTASRTTSRPGTRSRSACSSARLGSWFMWLPRYWQGQLAAHIDDWNWVVVCRIPLFSWWILWFDYQ
jgi:hypothetical protein